MKFWLLVVVLAFPAFGVNGSRASPSHDGNTQITDTSTAREPACPTDYASSIGNVQLDASQINRDRVLVRDPGNGQPKVRTQILSTVDGSKLWATNCAVFLGQRKPDHGCKCRHIPLFNEKSRLAIYPLSASTFAFSVENLKAGGHLAGILVPRIFTDPNAKPEITWLYSTLTNMPDFDFYVYLQDTSHAQTKDHKAYWIEAFDRSDSDCDGHRPDVAICQDEGENPAECSESNGATTGNGGTTFCTFQTDTGGGHEGPPN